MSDAVSAPPLDVRVVAQRLLSASAIAWFVPACVGQWIFTGYIVLKYVAPALRGDVSGWNDVMVNGLIRGDLAGNIALGVHLFIAFAITAGGTLQLIPAVRRGAPSFHRWNGRAYVVIALITSLAALYMTWTRHQLGGVVSAVGISLDAVLIIFFSGMTFVSARSRRFGVHHDWALRTFVAVSAVWYMRVSYGFLILAFQGQPPGSTEHLNGPLDYAIGFWSYLLPLAVLELYLRAKQGSAASVKMGVALIVFVGALITAVGVAGATMIMWLPRIT